MTCTFCFDHDLLQATGNGGELAPIVCPVCGSGDIELVRVCPRDPEGYARCTVPETIPCESFGCLVLKRVGGATW